MEPAQKPASKSASKSAPRTPAKITAQDISMLLGLIFSVLAASLPDIEYMDNSVNPPRRGTLHDLWDIPADEMALISEPAARIISRASNDVQQKIIKNWDMLALSIGLIGVIGLRGAKHYEILKSVKTREQSGTGAGRPAQGDGDGGGAPTYNIWERWAANPDAAPNRKVD
jgi:hypothetical protein